jgi:hypothetical protein
VFHAGTSTFPTNTRLHDLTRVGCRRAVRGGMKHPHTFFSSRIGNLRNPFAFVLLFIAGLGCARASRAQSEEINASRVADANMIDRGLKAHIAALPSSPIPKVEPATNAFTQQQPEVQFTTDRKHAFYWLDRTALTYGLVQGSAEIFDGVTTRYFIHHCSHCFEDDPMSRLLLGTHPSWGKMIPMGIAEAAVSAYSYQRMRRSPHRFARAAAPLLPMGLTAVHVIEGARNISLKNKYRCLDPGYVVVGAFCVPGQPPTAIGVTEQAGTGLGSHRYPK